MIASVLYLHISHLCELFVGVEARGFMFGPSIALAIGAKFVPLRKPRKLPGKLNENGTSKRSFHYLLKTRNSNSSMVLLPLVDQALCY